MQKEKAGVGFPCSRTGTLHTPSEPSEMSNIIILRHLNHCSRKVSTKLKAQIQSEDKTKGILINTKIL